MRTAVAAVALAMMTAISPASAQTTTTTTIAFPEPPDGFLASSTGEVKGEIQFFCWTEGTLTVCGDVFEPIDPAVTLSVPGGEQLTLRFDTPRTPTSVTVFRRETPGGPTTHTFVVPPSNPAVFTPNLPPGTSFLRIETRWGITDDVMYVFEIALGSTTSTSTSTTSTTSTSTPTTSTTTPTSSRTCHGLTPTIAGTSGPDVIAGTSGPDVIVGGGGDDQISGGAGDDVICGQGGDDVLNGGTGDDRLNGNAGDDRILGYQGNDLLQGNRGRDVLNAVARDAGAFADTLDGGPETDQCYSDPADTPPSSSGGDC